MSSTGISTDSTAVAAADKMFFCYQCNRTVTISISSAIDPFCPICNEGFLEEFEEPIVNPTPFSFADDPFSPLIPLLFGSSPPLPSFFGSSINQRNSHPAVFDPVSFLHNHLHHLRSNGRHVQIVIENHPSDSANRLPGNFGDYFFGPGFEELIQQLAENDPNRHGTPPASKSAIEALPTVKVTMDMLNSEMNQCAVCMDEFEDGSDVKQMPCKHVFHQDCLLPWLELHNSCPVCRFELPTDDPDYENRTRGAQGSGDGEGSVEGQQTPRRFSIQLPWPFRRPDGSGSDPGQPGSGTGGSGGNFETRVEDLD